MKKIICIVAALVSAAGCATTQSVMTPEGDQGVLINCSGASQWVACYKKAEQTCSRRGYIVHDKNADSETNAIVTDDNLLVDSTTQRTLLISCR